MSFCRFGSSSDVYMYEHVGGFIVCQQCKLGGSETFDAFTIEGRRFYCYQDAREHLRQHESAGHQVPSSAFFWCDEDGDVPKPDLCDTEGCIAPVTAGWNEESGKRRNTCHAHIGKHFGMGVFTKPPL